MARVVGAEFEATVASSASPFTADAFLNGSDTSSSSFALERERVADRYDILGLIGVGGMGSVYRARDIELDELVALKALRRELIDTPGMLERFRREVKLARRVTHQNVARVFDIGEHRGERFLTMELIDGESLASVLQRKGPMGIGKVVDVACAICAGLSAAHSAGVVHRDLKPDNILIDQQGRVVITDFGIARATIDASSYPAVTTGLIVGTPAYMAPEQVEGKATIDARADIYALGAMLYELLTGVRPWQADSALGTAAARLIAPPPDPQLKRRDIPDAVAQVVIRCMARSPEERYQTADQVASDLNAITLPASSANVSSRSMPPASLSPASGSSPTLGSSPTPGSSSTPKPSSECCADKTVAVLPFRNLGSPEHDYLAEGMTDDLIDTLSMTSGLKVCARGVVMKLKGVDRDPRDIGRELGVQVVVEGSVRRTPSAVRINARLISVADGFQLWAKRFDRSDCDLLVINDEAAQAIAEALTLHIAAPCRQAPSDPAALDLYFRARSEFRKFWLPNTLEAISLFEEALKRAPQDSMILAGCAMARARLWFFDAAAGPAAIQTAEKAIALAPDSPEARVALGIVRLQAGDTIAAVHELKRALKRAPSLAEANLHLGRILSEVGLTGEALRLLNTALSVDPSYAMTVRELMRIHALLGDMDKVEHLIRSSMVKPDTADHVTRARICLWHGDIERAKALRYELDAANEGLRPMSSRISRDILALIIDGTVIAAPELDAPSGDTTDRRHAFFAQLETEMAMRLGQRERALSAIARSVRAGLMDLLWLERCPLLAPLLQDPSMPSLHAEVRARANRVIEAYFAPLT